LSDEFLFDIISNHNFYESFDVDSKEHLTLIKLDIPEKIKKDVVEPMYDGRYSEINIDLLDYASQAY
jgi:hypothetical protein